MSSDSKVYPFGQIQNVDPVTIKVAWKCFRDSTSLKRGAMRWVLGCTECHKEFTQSVVPRSFHDYLVLVWPPKPEFPQGGMRMQCPNCRNVSVYERYQLVLRT